MKLTIPKLGTKLNGTQKDFLAAFAKSARRSIIEMTAAAASGHPGGSLSCVDYLSLLYSFILGQTGEKIVVSNGHISPAVYGVLAEMGYVKKEDVIGGFRKADSIFEGHVTRHVPGVWYGTGPLGAGVSAAAGFALGEKMRKGKKHVYALIGDGEAEEGQVYEMMNFAHKYELNNFIVFMDWNSVQLSGSLKNIMPIDPNALFSAAGWHVIEVNGHDYEDMWLALGLASKIKHKPVLLLGRTIMGYGVQGMQQEGERHRSTWHGVAPKPNLAEEMLAGLTLTNDETALLAEFKKQKKWKPGRPEFPKAFSKTKIKVGRAQMYGAGGLHDCRSAYGTALLDIARANKNVVALTADVAGSVKTDGVETALPGQHIECGIAEQHMVSCSGGLSLDGFVPFCSTFGAFMTSRAKDQARVNDINETNVKMVATHCGLSVGEDGPTHQAIDDAGSFAGFFNTYIIEPADANHTDRIIRYIAERWGNFYVRMGRHKVPILTKENGQPFYDASYKYEYGKCDLLRRGTDITIVAAGSVAAEALAAHDTLKNRAGAVGGGNGTSGKNMDIENKGAAISAEIIIASSPSAFDATLIKSIKKTGRVLVVQDHATGSGLGKGLAAHLTESNIAVTEFKIIGVEKYQLSGTVADLYKSAGIDADGIVRATKALLKK